MKRIFLTLIALLLIGTVLFVGARVHTGNPVLESFRAGSSVGANILGLTDECNDETSQTSEEIDASDEATSDEATDEALISSPDPIESIPVEEENDNSDSTSEEPLLETPEPEASEIDEAQTPLDQSNNSEPGEDEADTPSTEPEKNLEAEEAPVESNDQKNAISSDDFYFAFFDVVTEGKVKAAIPGLIVRFHGHINGIDPSDLTDIVLTRNGNPVDNQLSSSYQLTQGVWQYKEITDCYFAFTSENREPGTYGLTGKYKGVPFSVYNKIIEAPITNDPADPNALEYVTWGYYPDRNGEPMKITELVFGFKGIQNTFYQSDLTDIKLFVNGVETPIRFRSDVFRYLEYDNRSGGDTSYNLIIIDAFTESGTYVITGKYRGVEFTSYELTIP